MGEIPDRSFFAPPEPALRASLLPYLALTRSVRGGDLKDFFAVVGVHTSVFERDGTATLVRRLASSVVKAGLRRVSSAYSRISFADIATRLSLPSASDAEFLCAKAVADGIIDGSLDHAAGMLTSSSTPNVYTTPEPAEAFAKRIAFCLDVHNEAVRAMKYPPRPANAALESSEKAREREREDEQLLEELGDEGDEDEGMD
jgi:26S proteasome regulatory subunit N3